MKFFKVGDKYYKQIAEKKLEEILKDPPYAVIDMPKKGAEERAEAFILDLAIGRNRGESFENNPTITRPAVDNEPWEEGDSETSSGNACCTECGSTHFLWEQDVTQYITKHCDGDTTDGNKEWGDTDYGDSNITSGFNDLECADCGASPEDGDHASAIANSFF